MTQTRWPLFALLGTVAVACFMQACGSSTSRSDVKQEPYGKMPDGTQVDRYTLTNANGMQAGIITYGGALVQLMAPDKSGKLGDVVLAMDDLDGMRQQDA